MFKIFQNKQNTSDSFLIKTSNRFQFLETTKNIVNDNNINKKYLNGVNNDFNINNTEFPTLNNNIKILDSKINFTNISYKDETIVDNPVYTLFDKDNLVIDYNNLLDVVAEFASYRIYANFLLLNRKITILKMIYSMDYIKGEVFYNYFDLTNLITQERHFRKCLKNVNLLLSCIYLCESIVENYSVTKNTDTYCEYFQNEVNLLLNSIQKLITENIIGENMYIDKLKNILSINETNYILFINNIIIDLSDLIKNIVIDNDPKIECNYHIFFEKINETSYIHLYGICSYTYLTCIECFDENDLFDLSISLKKLNLFVDDPLYIYETTYNGGLYDITTNDYISSDITINDFINLNKIIAKIDTQGFFNIISYNLNVNQYFYYDINEDLPFDTCKLKILNKPKNYTIVHSFIKKTNNKIHNIIPSNVYQISHFKINKWLHKSSSSLLLDYDNIYNDNKIYTNGCYIDYIFSELLKIDRNNFFIDKQKLNSFRRLAYFNSK